uniref:Uncharacterized protein n=1 Tax=Setaria italica TaxID=4555 RepID=K3XU35_SETIT
MLLKVKRSISTFQMIWTFLKNDMSLMLHILIATSSTMRP